MRSFCIIFLIFITQLTFSQSISSYWLNKEKFHKDAGISEIKETTIFYTENDSTLNIEYQVYDSLMNLISLKRYNDETKLIWQSLKSYNESNRIRKIETLEWINTKGYQSGHTLFYYHMSNNYTQRDYNQQGQIIYLSNFYFDEDTNLIRLETFTGDSSLIGFETAEYNYDKNLMRINQYNRYSKMINTFESPIRSRSQFIQSPSKKYNQYGDLVYRERNWSKKDRVFYTIEYIYDELGNWISQKRYKNIKNRKGIIKGKEIDMIKTREIQY